MQSQFPSYAFLAEFREDLNFSDVGESYNSWTEEWLLTDMPLEKPGVTPIDLGDEEPIKPYLCQLADVAERVPNVVQGAILAFNTR